MCLFCTLLAADLLKLEEHIGNIICSDILRLMPNSVHLLPGKCIQAASWNIWKAFSGTEKIKGAFKKYICQKSIPFLSGRLYLLTFFYHFFYCGDSSFRTLFYPYSQNLISSGGKKWRSLFCFSCLHSFSLHPHSVPTFPPSILITIITTLISTAN